MNSGYEYSRCSTRLCGLNKNSDNSSADNSVKLAVSASVILNKGSIIWINDVYVNVDVVFDIVPKIK